MRVHGYVSHVHYADHVLPVLNALPAGMRGDLFAASDELAQVLRLRGVKCSSPRDRRAKSMPAGDPVLIAGFVDLRAMRGRPVALLEHGAGQTYTDVRDGSYAGGRGRDRVSLFLCPSERVAEANRAVYPNAEIEVVGCPRLDVLWKTRNEFARHRDGNRVAVSFHWPCALTPEAGSAWDEFRADVVRLVSDSSWVVLGHGHPRHWRRMRRWWESLGVEPVEDWVSVVRRADAFVCDNSSTMFEACAIDLPVVVANSNRYRRSVEHGMRFWRLSGMGPHVSPGDDLAAASVAARDGFVLERDWVAGETYAFRPDGREESTMRAAEAVIRWATR